MANQSFVSGQVAVGASAVLVASPPGRVVVQASVTGIYVGGSNVTTSNGFELPATTPVELPGGPLHDLYAVGATGTLSYIYPGGN